MASAQPGQAIADRAEIYKSCRSLENVVNLLNDYCEAARGVVALQKKLSKALKEAAGLKATGEIAANALSTSASMFEVLSDVDSKFAKLVDKECDAVSGEVRKWFKKLAKEEKVHDDKISNANAKIKQAGQLYEKKAKKNSYDAVEEHTRYINLLSSMGPEISQEKYNHSLMVNQRNTAITYSVAACLSRVADAEWLRSSEGVRRFSPLVGQLGEWRTLCEAGWTGALPGDLPDVDAPPDRAQQRPTEPQRGRNSAEPSDKEQGSSPLLPQSAPPGGQPNSNTVLTPFLTDDDDRKKRSPTSLASLASFPTPPAHFPLPPVSSSKPSTPAPASPVKQYTAYPYEAIKLQSQSQLRTSSDISHSSSAAAAATSASVSLPKVIEFSWEGLAGETATPALTNGTDSPVTPRDALLTPPIRTMSPLKEKGRAQVGLGLGIVTGDKPAQSKADEEHPEQVKVSPTAVVRGPEVEAVPRQTKASSSNNSRASSYTAVNSFKKGDYLDEKEFGVEKTGENAQLKTRSLDVVQSRRVERTDTMKSNGSMVATIREKYSRATGPASPPPRDVPRLPLSVNDLASKYRTISEAPVPSSPRKRTLSPSTDQPLQSLVDAEPQIPTLTPTSTHTTTDLRPLTFPTQNTVSLDDDISRRRRRIEELEDLELRERAVELRVRERQLDLRARELAVESNTSLRSRGGDGYASDASFSRRPPHRHVPQSPRTQPSLPSLQSRYSYSTTSLQAPPPSSPFQRSPEPQLHSHSHSQSQQHPPNCTCPACTVARYATDPVPIAVPAPQKPTTTKGWRRRLSMPVVVSQAFSSSSSSESKKDKGPYAVGVGIAGGIGRLGEANRSVASFGRR